MSKFIDLTGMKFGRYTVISRNGSDSNGSAMWKCKCDCGNIRTVRGYILKKGQATSCGCVRNTHISISNKRLYGIWSNIKQRCTNSKSESYKDYGGRGISICEEWKNSSKKFVEWSLKNGYRDDLTIDRIDVNGNYEPSNCRWITNKEQQYNKRCNHRIYYNGEIKTVAEWSEKLGINSTTIITRLNRYGWSVERTLGEKVHTHNINAKIYQYSKDYKLIKIWNKSSECDKYGYISSKVISCCRGRRKTHKGYIWSYTKLD